jgi:hypothetical protein
MLSWQGYRGIMINGMINDNVIMLPRKHYHDNMLTIFPPIAELFNLLLNGLSWCAQLLLLSSIFERRRLIVELLSSIIERLRLVVELLISIVELLKSIV